MKKCEEQMVLPLVQIPESANYSLPDDNLLAFYHDLEERIFWVTDEINSYTLNLVHYILKWNREDKNIPIEKRKPIRLLVLSPGGDLDIEETLVSLIKMSKTPIYGIAMGMVASAASMIFLSTHKRYALRNTYFILHKGSCQNISGDYTNVQNAMEDYRRQIEALEDFYIKYTKIDPQEIKKNLLSDWYIRGEDLKTKGLIDEWVDNIEVFL